MLVLERKDSKHYVIVEYITVIFTLYTKSFLLPDERPMLALKTIFTRRSDTTEYVPIIRDAQPKKSMRVIGAVETAQSTNKLSLVVLA